MSVATLDNVAKLYVATFNRAPDSAGLNYWANSGMSLEDIAQSFFDQPETQTTYPSGTQITAFVTSVYQNLFNRAPDQAGLDYWAHELEIHTVSNQNFILAVINGAEASTGNPTDAAILTNKATVGLSFANAGLEDVELARSVMTDVNDTSVSVDDAIFVMDQISAPVGAFTIEMLSGISFYTRDNLIWSEVADAGLDSMDKDTLAPDGTDLFESFTAPFGSTTWTSTGTPEIDGQWSIVNGRLQITGDDYTDTLTLISQSAAGMLVNEDFTQYSTNEHTSEIILLATAPFDTARTQDEIVVGGHIHIGDYF